MYRWPHSKKGSLSGAFSALHPKADCTLTPKWVPSFISRGATHHTGARDLCYRRKELLPNSEFTKVLGSFTCRKAGTWDRFFHFPSEGRHAEDYSDTREIRRLPTGSNPRTRAPEASMLTTSPPKPLTTQIRHFLFSIRPDQLCGSPRLLSRE